MGKIKDVFRKVGAFVAGALVGGILVSALGAIYGTIASYGVARVFHRRGEPYMVAGVVAGVIYKLRWIGIAVGAIQAARGAPYATPGMVVPIPLPGCLLRSRAFRAVNRRPAVYPAGTLHPHLRTVIRGRTLVRYTPR